MQESASVTSSFGKVLKGVGASLASMAVTAIATELLSFLYKVGNVSNEVANAAAQAGEAFNSAKDDIEGYKERVQELHDTMNDSNSSFEDITNARKELYSIQKEMVDKYGTEVSAINDITKAIDIQNKSVKDAAKAWDNLLDKQWQEQKNKFNEFTFSKGLGNFLQGYSDNIDRMESEYFNNKTEINLSKIKYSSRDGEYQKFKNLLEKSFGATFSDTGDFAKLSGTATEVHDKLIQIQRVAEDFHFNSDFLSDLTTLANKTEEFSDKYKDFATEYALKDVILADKDNGYVQVYEDMTSAYEKYNDAVESGDEEAANKAKTAYMEAITNGIETATEKGDQIAVFGFKNLYPELQAEAATWTFTVDFQANKDNLRKSVQDAAKFLKDEGYTIDDIENMDYSALEPGSETEKNYTVLREAAEKYQMSLSDINDQLSENYKLESANYQQAVKKFGKQNIDNLSDENKEILYGIDEKTINDTIDRVRQNAGSALSDTKNDVDVLKSALNQLISEAKTGEDITPLSKSGMIDLINSMSDGFDVLDKIYADVIDGGAFDFTQLDTKKFSEAFKDLDGEYEAFIEKVSSTPNDVAACQSAFDDLTYAYINHSGVLDEVTEDTAQLTISMLENMGIANAAELVNAALAENTAYLAAQKVLAANASIDLTNVTAEEIKALAADSDMADTTKQQIALLALQKQLCNDQIIKTDGDIANLQALAEQAGATQAAIAAVKLTNDKVTNAGSGRRYSNNPDDAKKLWQKTYDEIYGSISNNTQLKNPAKTNGSGTASNSGSSGYKPSYKGSTDTQKTKDSANKAKESENKYDENLDFFEQRVKVLNQSLDILDKNLENVLGSKHKNQLLSAQSDIVSEEMKNYTDALAMYQAKAKESLSKIDSSLRDKVVNGSVSITEFIGKSNEDTVKAIQTYQGWEEKIGDCKEQLAALAKQLREIELSKFNNIVDEYTDKTDLFTKATDNINKQIDLFEQAGQIIGEGFYDAQKVNSQKQLNLLEEEKAKLVKQLNEALSSGNIQKGTDEWLEMVNTLSDLDGSILDCKKSIEEMDDAILKLHTEQFERIQTAFDNIKTELEDLVDIIDDADVSSDSGKWTNEGITKLGLLAQQYETSKLQAQRYGEEIEKLNQDYLAGKYSATEYADNLADLTQKQYDSIKAYQDTEDAIIEVNKARVDIMIDGINEETEAYQKLIQSKKDALSAEKD